jgi:isoquinoline 1-oxidoreductase alpha subunit
MEVSKFSLKINGKQHTIDADPSTPLLWVIREHVGLTGTKYGCGVAQCGSCTIHINGNPVRSCVLPVSAAQSAEITTIEGISEDRSHPLQKAWVEEQVPQCGYCQSGQIMQAVALLNNNKKPSRDEIISHMNGVLCRCGTYIRIIKAIERAALDS